MGTVGRILVTGATGFLGREIVAVARRRGIDVAVLTRSDCNLPAAWHGDPGIIRNCLDLASPEAKANLAIVLQGVDAVIHAAATLSGTDNDHVRDTIGATETLIRAILAQKTTGVRLPRLVLVSSLSVYGYAALPDYASLDERTPIESDPDHRDAYCRAKQEQERLALRAAQHDGLEVRLLRVGTVYGVGRTWSSRLGVRIAGWVICPGGDVPVPAIHVEHCAQALLQAAWLPIGPDDVPIMEGAGHLDIVNLVDPNPPSQEVWLRAIGCSRMIRLPLGFVSRFVRGFDMVGALVPVTGRYLPNVLREATFAARFKPLQYSIARAEDRLDHTAVRPFVEAMKDSRVDSTTVSRTL